MPFAGAAASVAYAEQDGEIIQLILFGVVFQTVIERPGVTLRIVSFVRRHMYYDRRIVYALPNKGAVREFIVFVPTQLYRQEIIYPAFFQYLRHIPRKTENVREPAHTHILAEFFLPIPFAVQVLTNDAFAARHVGIAFYPHSSLYFQLSGSNLFFQLFEQFGIAFFYPFELLRLRSPENIIGILVHIIQLVDKGPDGFALRFPDRPQPRQIQMRVTGGIGGKRQLFAVRHFTFQDLACRRDVSFL